MKSEKKRILVIGARRGIGAAVAQHFAQQGDYVFSVSRNQPIAGEWIQADISTSKLKLEVIQNEIINGMVYIVAQKSKL
jgi:NAD(P)-dependent dehydrogenase (short-subunit alcohol dehydrogenase family)